MLTSELFFRVLLAVLVTGRIGFCQLEADENQNNDWARSGGNKKADSDYSAESRLLSSAEEPGILLPADDKYNFVGNDDPVTTRTIWRKGRSSQSSYPATTVVSTNSYSIRPENSGSSSSGSGSSVTIDAKPVSIITSSNSYTVKPSSSASGSNGYYGSSTYPSYSQPKNSNDKTTIFVKNNCFGTRCPQSESTKQGSEDDWKSYHYVLNKDVKQKQKYKRYEEGPSRRNDDFENLESIPWEHQMTLSIPFRVKPAVSPIDTQYPFLHAINTNRNNRRFSRTTTSTTTPGWVQLPPIHPDNYDPFQMNDNRTNFKGEQQKNQNAQFSNRLGVELNPESFADRWGWGEQTKNSNKGSGSRLPTWLQEIHGSLQGGGGPTRDSDNKNWVKLDPIPVSGVTISKWVPKGTPTSELPTTNWQTRDRPLPSGGFSISNNNNDNNNKRWWDHIDNVNKLHRPQSSYLPSLPPPVSVESHHGWGPSKGSSAYPNYDRAPTNAWSDVIYPGGPSSATASWQQDKDMTKYASSFPLSTSSSSSGWPSNNNNHDVRRPVTGSWSADRSNSQFSGNPYGGGNRRYGSASSSYPDRNINEDDPRWILVSNSRKVTVAAPDTHRVDSYGYHDGKFKPGFDKFSDFPFYEPTSPYNHRLGKDFKDLLNKRGTPTPQPLTNQDDAFSKVNATLASLTPVLSLRGSTLKPSDLEKIRATSSTTKAPKKRLPAFLKPYMGDGRNNLGNGKNNLGNGKKNLGNGRNNLGNGRNNLGNNKTYTAEVTAPAAQTFRKGLSMNPVYAAVGAGMIPATMAAVLPMVLGRRRRDIRYNSPVTRTYFSQPVHELIFSSIRNNHNAFDFSNEGPFSNLKSEADEYSLHLHNDLSDNQLRLRSSR